ncbi:peptidoglycan-recognition protein 3-like [Euwallacea similis]|uniref:peptidoglycan-recognition protein 3-like n=1 Tax=Euwallacea similis TaxID=1736056 RepID=UPI00345098CD
MVQNCIWPIPGPITKFNLQKVLTDNEPDALPDPASQVKPPIAPKKSSKKRIIWLTFLAFITSLAGVVIGLRPWETVSSKEITTQLPETTTQFDNYGAIVSRENWGAKPSKSPLQPMNKAATLVVINHTGGKSCSTFLQCSQRVKDIQLEHFNVKNYRDISYNFLLGGDGRIYLGRGWRVTNEGRNESVDFAFIGNFNDLEPSNEILNMANWLISAGGWEDPNAINLSKYYVISNNLTEPSNSPGAHLYAKMNDFVFHTFKLCYANCSDGSYVQSKICPPEEAISC